MAKVGRPQEYTDEMIIKALHTKKGYVYLAARLLGCAHSTVFKRIKENPQIQEIVESYRGHKVDNAELKLDRAVANNEAWAIAFTLKTIGKDRGYTERTEFSGPEGQPIRFSWDATVTEIERGSIEDTNPSGTHPSLEYGS